MTLDNQGLRGCVFDFDGTIILSEHIHMRAWEDLAKAEGAILPDRFLEQSVGMSDRQCVLILAEAWGRSADSEILLARKRGYYMQRCPLECFEVPGVTSLIMMLKSMHIPMAVATSSTREEVIPVLQRLGILDCFVHLWTVEDVARPKPDPEIYQRAARSLGLRPQECLAIEDSVAGAISATAAGCKLITIQTLYTAEVLGPAIMSVRDFNNHELLDFMRTLKA